jgi:outer membrane protein
MDKTSPAFSPNRMWAVAASTGLCALFLIFGAAPSKAGEMVPVPLESEPAGAFSSAKPLTFRELASEPRRTGKYTVLSREKVAETTLAWRKEMRDAAAGSPYADVGLPDLILIVLQQNYPLQNSQRGVDRAQSFTRGEASRFKPEFTLGSGAQYGDSKASPDPVSKTNNFNYGAEIGVLENLPTGGTIVATTGLARDQNETEISGAADTNNDYYTGNLNLSLNQPLLRGGGFEVGLSGLRQSRLNELSAHLENHINQRDASLDVIQRYYNILITISNIEVSQAALEVDEKAIKDEEYWVYEAGLHIPNEIALAQVQYFQDKLQVVQRKEQLLGQIEDLLETLGLPLNAPISFQELGGAVLDAELAQIPGRDAAVQEALANRPEIMLADIEVRSREIALEVANNNILPDLDLTADYGDTEISDELTRALNLDERRSWSAGIAISIPLPNTQRKETLKRAKLDLETAETNRIITERGIVSEVDSLIRQVQRSEESIDLLKKTVDQAAFSFELEQELFKTGERTSNDMREAQDDFFKSQVDYNVEILTYQTLLARLYRALGRPLY